MCEPRVDRSLKESRVLVARFIQSSSTSDIPLDDKQSSVRSCLYSCVVHSKY